LLAGAAGEASTGGGLSDDEAAEAHSPWASKDGFQLSGVRSLAVPIVIDGEDAIATVSYGGDGIRVAVENTGPATNAKVFEAGAEAFVIRHGRQTRVRIKDFALVSVLAGTADGLIKAPMHGRVLEVLVGVGDRVTGGQRLAVIEAMKMEHTLRAPFAGVVTQLPIAAGAQVVEGAEIMMIEAPKTQ
jgi:3-methylcrotonyl-CoA carboxylase alpha subunit